uniref:DNA repair protein RAD50 n=1 Tax=Lotharella oceanica TaxID=641309 RepID=A0A7S2TX56_9EUKA
MEDLGQKRELLQKIDLMLVYREKSAAVIRVKKGILKMKEELKILGGADLAGSTEQVRAKVQEYQSRIDQITGKIETQREQIRHHRSELRTTRLKNIAERHRRALIECQATKLALKDLEIYSKALEKALMEFHSAKMAEINEVLRDYWQTTYCGNDIEEIQIQSNHTQEIKGRRQYNYRVIMKQRDTELDMRGRCSAGQKVLASLLIRLALAETFCTRCGVLALDEPTTNLDQANIRQFARALNEIIEKRAKQENFQIIIITHDEEFVDMLGQRDHCDYYYRVYKDEEQCSRIKQQPFNA